MAQEELHHNIQATAPIQNQHMHQNQEQEETIQLEEQNQAPEEFQWPEFLPAAQDHIEAPENNPMQEEQGQQEHIDTISSQGSAQQANMVHLEPNSQPKQAITELNTAQEFIQIIQRVLKEHELAHTHNKEDIPTAA